MEKIVSSKEINLKFGHTGLPKKEINKYIIKIKNELVEQGYDIEKVDVGSYKLFSSGFGDCDYSSYKTKVKKSYYDYDDE